jgi:hypothetical protein
MLYQTVILRVDGNHISVLESENFDECMAKWQGLQEQWDLCAKEGRSFTIKDPVITAFPPALIAEILLRPLSTPVANQSGNPYHKQMMQQGLTEMFNGRDLISKVNPY